MNCNGTVIALFFFNKYTFYNEGEVIASNSLKCTGSNTMVMPTKLSISNKQHLITYFCQCFQEFLLDLNSYMSLINGS